MAPPCPQIPLRGIYSNSFAFASRTLVWSPPKKNLKLSAARLHRNPGVMRKKPQSFEEAENNVARLILTNYPNVKDKDFLTVSIVYGFDIGIASGWQRYNASYPPAEWQSKITGVKQ